MSWNIFSSPVKHDYGELYFLPLFVPSFSPPGPGVQRQGAADRGEPLLSTDRLCQRDENPAGLSSASQGEAPINHGSKFSVAASDPQSFGFLRSRHVVYGRLSPTKNRLSARRSLFLVINQRRKSVWSGGNIYGIRFQNFPENPNDLWHLIKAKVKALKAKVKALICNVFN